MIEYVLDKVKEILPDFEARTEQKDMMLTVYESMLNNKKAAIHAPTGTGKTLGYLLPFLAVKMERPDFRITISTYTLNLQAQLIKDLAFIHSLYQQLKPMEKPLSYTILKGRNNYFCEKRFIENEEEVPFSFHEAVQQKVWELRSNNTSLDRQNFGIKMNSAQWETMQVETCKKEDCPFHAECSFFHDYYGEKSDIVITNHALYFNRELFVIDAWKDFSFHIFDEAHKVEKVILDVSTFHLTATKIENWAKQGINLAYKYKFNAAKINAWATKFLFKNKIVFKFKKGLEAIETRLTDDVSTLQKLRFKEDTLSAMIDELASWQKDMYDAFQEELVPHELEEQASFKEERSFWVMNFGELYEFKNTLNLDENKRKCWIERNAYGEIELKVTPTSISYIPPLFNKGTLFASGTLSQDNSCAPFAQRLNVQLDVDKVFPTPFALSEQTKVYASSVINPKHPSYEALLQEEIWNLLLKGEMNSFVLFTSTQLMERMFKKLKPSLLSYAKEHALDLDVWLQEKTNHKEIMESFKNKEKKSVLFGTLSYFEGIDLQKEALTQIILTRLPFSVPTHPIQEILDHNEQYSKWEALIRFEQAFGRLIRTQEDYGTFSILDNRVYEPQHQEFLNVFKKENIPVTSDIQDIELFYQQRKEK